MKMRPTILFPLLLGLFFWGKDATVGFIELEYYGDQTKPIPIVIFYLSGSIDTTSEEGHYIKKIEVTKVEFEGIRNTILRRDFVQSDTLSDYYSFFIIQNGEKTDFQTKNKKTIQQVFQGILKQFNNPGKQYLVEEQLAKLARIFGLGKVSD